jgi:hypothetical protein
VVDPFLRRRILVKRLRLLVVLGVIAVALPIGILRAGATGTTGTNSVYIQDTADFNFSGTQLDVGLYVRCSGGSGLVDVFVQQYPPETPSVVADGSGAQPVVCDGVSRRVGATVIGALYDAGWAKATATLLAPSGTKTVTKWINIVVV